MGGLVFWLIAGIALVWMIRRTKRKARLALRPASSVVVPDIRRVAFDYIDMDGNVTTREITADRYVSGKIIGYCHLRRAQRSFFVSSIIGGGVVDVETGGAARQLPGQLARVKNEASGDWPCG